MSENQSNEKSRPVQTGMFAILPTELILDIIGAVNDNPVGYQATENLDNLSQTCSRLYDLVRPFFFRANGYRQFYLSVRAANVAMMDRCEYYDAAPVHRVWPDESTNLLPAPRLKLSVDLLLDSLNEDKRIQDQKRDQKRANILNALGWLLQRGANGATIKTVWLETEPGRRMKLPGHMSTHLLDQMQYGIGKRAMGDIFKMMKMLSGHGFPTPTRTDPCFRPVAIQSQWYNEDPLSYFVMSPLKIALKSHVIPSVLELMLSEHADRGIKLRDWYSERPASLVRFAIEGPVYMLSRDWAEFTSIDKLIDILHADLHKEHTGWEESYFGEVADTFQEKLKLMIEYEMIDASEEALLKSIGAALYSIAADGMKAGSHYGEEYLRTSWEKLGDAVKPFATDFNLVVFPGTRIGSDDLRRVHRFYIHPEWNPWESWFRRQDGVQRQGWVGLDITAVRIPEWHRVSMDEWYASTLRLV